MVDATWREPLSAEDADMMWHQERYEDTLRLVWNCPLCGKFTTANNEARTHAHADCFEEMNDMEIDALRRMTY